MFSFLDPSAIPRPEHSHHRRRHYNGEPYAAAPSPSEDQGNFWKLDTFLLLLLLPGWGYYIIFAYFLGLSI